MQYLNEAELSKLFRVMHAGNKMHHLAALTAFWTGARVSQVLRLQGQDIFESKGKVVIKIHAAKHGNEHLHTLHIDADPAFDMSPVIALAKTRPTARLFAGLTRQYQNIKLKAACVEAGIHTDFGHMHTFRHSSALVVWNATHSLGSVSQFLQHKSPQSSLIYLAENDSMQAQGAMDALQLA